jgi:hypothetical protein
MFLQNYKNKYLKYKLKYLNLKYGGANNLDELGLTDEEIVWYNNHDNSNLKNNQIIKETANRDTFKKKIKLRNKLDQDLKNEQDKLENDAKGINMSQGFIKSTIQRIQMNIIRINIELKYIRTNYYNYNNLSSFEQEQLIEEELDKQLLIKFNDKTIVELKDFDNKKIINIKNRIKKRKEIKEKKELVRSFFVELFYYLKKHNNCFKTGTLVFEDNNNKLYNLLTFGIISDKSDCKLGDPIAQQNYFINKYKEVFKKTEEVKSNDKCFEQGYIEYIRGCRNNKCLTLELTFNQGVNDLCDNRQEKILRSCIYYKFEHNNRQYIFLKLLNENETEYHETYDRNERIEDPSKKYPSKEKDNIFYNILGKNFNNIDNIQYYNDFLRTGNEMFITEELKNHCIDFEIYDSEIDNSDSEVFSTIDSKNEEDPGEDSEKKTGEDSGEETGEETGEDSGEDSGEETEKNSSSKKKKRENQKHRQKRIKREKKAREIAEQKIVERERERAQRE